MAVTTKGKSKTKAKAAAKKTRKATKTTKTLKKKTKMVAKKKKVVKRAPAKKTKAKKAKPVAKKVVKKVKKAAKKATSATKKKARKTVIKAKTATKAAKKQQKPKSPTASTVRAADNEPKFEPYQPAHDEEYMNEEQSQHFKEILENWRRDLMEEVDHTITEMKEATVLADPNDRATQEETFNLELRTRDRERKLLKKIEEAIGQIDDNDYGYCESCGVEIGIRRLEARPTATLCIDCKTIAEIKEKRA